jgi:hypothetical protein
VKPPDKGVCVEIKKRLIRLCEAYQRDLTPEMLQGYIDALGDLNEFQVSIAFVTAMRRGLKFMPNAGEIRESLQIATEKLPPQKNENTACPDCHGSGWKTVPHPRAGEDDSWKHYTQAVPCIHVTVP